MEKRLHGVYLREKFPSPCLFYFVPLRSPLRLLNPKNDRRRNTLWIHYYKTVRFEYLSFNHFRILLFLFKSLLHFQILLPKIWTIIETAVTTEDFVIIMTRSYKGVPSIDYAHKLVSKRLRFEI